MTKGRPISDALLCKSEGELAVLNDQLLGSAASSPIPKYGKPSISDIEPGSNRSGTNTGASLATPEFFGCTVITINDLSSPLLPLVLRVPALQFCTCLLSGLFTAFSLPNQALVPHRRLPYQRPSGTLWFGSVLKTASKKRKLTPTARLDTVPTAYNAPDTAYNAPDTPSRQRLANERPQTRQPQLPPPPHRLSSPRAPQSPVAVASDASRLPLDQPFAETAASPGRAAPTAQLSRSSGLISSAATTSVDSPSEAYAGLTLDSAETPLDTTGMNQDTAASPSDTEREIRSTSPAKRRASAMDDDHTMDMEQPASMQPRDVNSSDDSSNRPPTPSSSKGSSKQHTREASVDMLATTNGNSAATSTDPSSISETPGDQEMGDAAEVPSIDDQVMTIMQEMAGQPEDGDVGYLVAVAWINRVLARSSQKDDHGPYDKETLEGDVGPIDNSSILPSHLPEDLVDDRGEKYIQIKRGLSVNTELEIFTEKAFKLALKWYGLAPGQVPIKRYAHATNTDPDALDKNVQYELYPPIFTLRKLHAERSSFDKHIAEDSKHKAPRIVASRSCQFQKFLRRAKESTGIPMETKVKVWRVLSPETVASDAKTTNGNTLLSPPESREASPSGQSSTSVPLLIKSDVFKAMPEAVEREMIDMKDETNNEKYNGRAQLGTLGLAADQILILEEQSTSGSFLSDTAKKATKAAKKGGLLSNPSSGRSSPSLGPITRGRNRASGRTQGSVGLTNLGNTCYMNSALQCIRATEELTCFFLSKAWKKELNKSNPLGHEGKMAMTYAALLDSIYETTSSSFTPSDFKRMLSKCGPQFSGYGQQDSQEFMSFLVDALHEDMNRIVKKPYIENPDSDDSRVHDEEYIKELGNIFRENYRKRNDSVIHDLFNGFYKNTMVCPVCDKVSVTFDPYLLLTLQLPLEHSWQHTVYLLPLRGDPVKVEIDMDKHSTIGQLKQYVAAKVPGLDAKRLMMAEVFSKKFYRTVEDKQTIAEANIQPRDEMILYELDEVPTNFPPPKKKKYKTMLSFGHDTDEEAEIPGDDSPLADVMMVPVFQRSPASSYSSTMNLANTPFFITVNRDEAKNYVEIYRKVLARIASLTTRDFLHEYATESASSPEDEEQERISEEDAEPDVQARSVESEDGTVEVSVSKSQSNGDKKAAVSPTSARAVLEPGVPIPDALLNLFSLKIMEKQTEMVPTGFHAVQDNRKFKTLLSRLPKASRRPSVQAETPTSSESSDADEALTSVQASMADCSASEDDGSIGQKPKKLKMYGKKNRTNQPSAASTDEESSVDFEVTPEEPILHLGECLIVDWSLENFDALFQGRDEDDMRGRETIGKHTRVLEDKELSDKRRRRTERKKHGISLDECFQVTSRGEILTEDNAWYCNRCKELRQAEKTLEIWTAPDILVIHLKRFSAARQFRDKIDILVDFPTEGLNLNDKVGLQEGLDLTYDLFAVDNHYGGLGGGHYTAYAKNFVDEQWYEYNDSSVSKRPASSVVTSAAYLLFYRRRTSGPNKYLGPPGLRQLVSSFRNPEEEGATDSAAEDGDSQSRAASPSGQGKGHRLGGEISFHNGSSIASAGQGAGHLHRRGGDGSAAGQGALVKSGALAGLDGYEGDDDEGYGGGMDEDPDDALPAAGAFIGPQRPPSYQEASPFSAYQPWSFPNLSETNQAGCESDLAEADIDSNVPMGDGDEERMKLIEDFGDDLGTSAHNNSPIMASTEMDFIGEHMEGVQHFEDAEDPEPVDIHVDSSPPSTTHEKKE
ncbi:hypothetical protein, variant [Verruconis gallopava]|uniref:ubiquitinyl hydrolase 1 n=1 Tax=Verruconis gallopava TaxID=253628 RepID=A0A0D2ASH4_9PEZI|nr:hypothetical protein, variant [Verruconis gallopava]KIW02119.1 hypothetical protein, variant [Verruconis gallopava]